MMLHLVSISGTRSGSRETGTHVDGRPRTLSRLQFLGPNSRLGSSPCIRLLVPGTLCVDVREVGQTRETSRARNYMLAIRLISQDAGHSCDEVRATSEWQRKWRPYSLDRQRISYGSEQHDEKGHH